MATFTEIINSGASIEIRGDLYHGIPCRILTPSTNYEAAREGWMILERIDEVFNVYRGDSELGSINNAGAGIYRISPWLAGCLNIARQVEALSGGAWRASMLPLVRIWRQAARSGSEPKPTDLATAIAACDPNAWNIDGQSLRIHSPDVAFDLGGLAKGYAVGLVVDHLNKCGIDDFLIQVGGETACHGSTSDNKFHRIGIPHPEAPDSSWYAILQDSGEGLCGSTCGDYRQPILVAGRSGHHVIDPRSGLPTNSDLASVTCVFNGLGRNALVDGLSTAAAVLGLKSLEQFAAASGCHWSVLRRDPQRGLLETSDLGWKTLTVRPIEHRRQ